MSTLHMERHMESPTTEELLNAVDRLETSELRPFVSQVLARVARRLAPHLDGRESELLEKINQGLPHEAEKRYRELIAARQAETLTSAEMEELMSLTHRAEVIQAERVRHLADLAELRGVSLTKLMAELGIRPLPVE